MATQRIDPQANIQTTPVSDDPVSGAQAAVSRQYASSFASVEQAASQIGQIATNYLREQALDQAQKDAAGIVKYDKDNNLIVPTNFDAPIGGGLLYSQAYAKAAEANYKHVAIQEFQNKAVALQTQFPTDPESFSAKLIEYRDAKVNVMPADLRPMMFAHFETIRAQGATSIAAARQKAVNDVTMKHADQLRGSLVEDWSAFELSKKAGNFTQADYDAHEAKLKDRWNDVAAMMTQTGMPREAIEHQFTLMKTQAAARAFFRKMGDEIGVSGQSATAVVGAWQSRIAEFRKQHPGAEQQSLIQGEMQTEIARGNAQAAGTVNAQDVATQNHSATAADISAWEKDQRAKIRENPQDYPDQAGAYRYINEEAQRRRAALNSTVQRDPTIRPLQKATLSLSLLDANEQATQRIVATAAANQISVLQDVTSTPLQKSEALVDLKSSLRSPEMVAYSLSSPQGAALYNTVQRAVGQAHIESALVDIGAYREAWANGRVAPEDEAAMLQKGREKGWIGSSVPGQISNEEMVHIAGRNRELYRKNQQVNRDAAITIENIKAGGVPNEEERKRVASAFPFKVDAYDYATGKSVNVTPDFNNPGHLSSALAYVNKTLTVPEEFRQWLETAPGVADPEKRRYMLSAGQSVQKVFDNHFKTGPMGPVPLDERNSLVESQMRSQLGQGYEVMNAIANLGYDATPASIHQYISAKNRKRENGDKPDETAKGVLDELQGVARLASGNIFDDMYYGAASATEGAFAYFSNPSTVRRWGMMSDAATYHVMQGVAAKSALSTVHLGSKPIEIDSTLAQHIIGHGQRYKDQYGATDEANRLNPNRQAILDYFNRNGSDLALREVFAKDGTVEKYVLERKPFFLEANKAAGVNLNQKQWEDMMSLTARLKRPDLFVDGGQGAIDPSTVRMQSAERGDGSKMYGLYGYNWKTNSTVYIGDVSPNDETIGFARARIYQAVASEMRDSNVAAILSNMPIFGALLDQKMKDSVQSSMIGREGQRDLPSDFTASFFQTLRSAVSENAPLAQFTGAKYDDAWKKAEMMAAKGDLNRYGGLGFLLGLSSPEYFINPTQPPDNAPNVGGTAGGAIIDASRTQKQGLAESNALLEQGRSRNRGSRKPEQQ